jgi:hypothetical protein
MILSRILAIVFCKSFTTRKINKSSISKATSDYILIILFYFTVDNCFTGFFGLTFFSNFKEQRYSLKN